MASEHWGTWPSSTQCCYLLPARHPLVSAWQVHRVFWDDFVLKSDPWLSKRGGGLELEAWKADRGSAVDSPRLHIQIAYQYGYYLRNIFGWDCMAWPTRSAFPDEWQQTRITFCTKNINLAYELTSFLPYACPSSSKLLATAPPLWQNKLLTVYQLLRAFCSKTLCLLLALNPPDGHNGMTGFG